MAVAVGVSVAVGLGVLVGLGVVVGLGVLVALAVAVAVAIALSVADGGAMGTGVGCCATLSFPPGMCSSCSQAISTTARQDRTNNSRMVILALPLVHAYEQHGRLLS